jgi:hypothetical protein
MTGIVEAGLKARKSQKTKGNTGNLWRLKLEKPQK